MHPEKEFDNKCGGRSVDSFNTGYAVKGGAWGLREQTCLPALWQGLYERQRLWEAPELFPWAKNK